MPIRTIPGTDQQYHLVSFDESGKENGTNGGAPDSEALLAALREAGKSPTDVFFVAHGWKGDVPAAIEQFDSWLGAMHNEAGGRARAEARAGGFRPLIVGLHWPSQPWGDENIAASGARGGLLGGGDDEPVDFFADLLADDAAGRDALETILAAPRLYGDCQELPEQVREAYDTLFRASGLAGDDGLADLDDDKAAPWDPDAVFRAARAEEALAHAHSLGGGIGDALLSPLRQLSFWKMKNRARVVGESGIADLLARLMSASGPEVRYHLMGHSFGCIVASAAVQAASSKPGWRPVDSLLLVQGALSLWAFAASVPGEDKGTTGYFRRIVDNELVGGPMAATSSSHDTAVGRFYPIGARLRKQTTLAADLPKYGGIGAFGVQGAGAQELVLEPGNVTKPYGLARRKLYNLESSKVIAHGNGASGAHSDIAHPELAHFAWEMVTAPA